MRAISVLLLAASCALSLLGRVRDDQASFSLSIHAQQGIVKAGSPVMVDVVKTNTSDRVINNSRSLNPAEHYGNL